MWKSYETVSESYKTYYTIEYLQKYYQDRYYKLEDRLYKVEISFDSNMYSSHSVLTTYSDAIMSGLQNYYLYTQGKIANSSISFTYIYKKANVNIVEVKQTVTTTIPGRSRPLLSDAPYCMFCMPYGDIPVY